MIIYEFFEVSESNSDLMLVCNNSEDLGTLQGEFYGFDELTGSLINRVSPCRNGYECFDCRSASRDIELVGVRRNITCLNGTFDNIVFKLGSDEPVMFALAKFHGMARRIGANRFELRLK